MFEEMSSDRLTPKEARAWLEEAVTAELARIRDRRLASLETSDPAERADERLVDELAAHAYRLLARHGGSAVFSPEEDAEIAARGFTDDELRRGRDLLETLRRDFWSDARHARTGAEADRVLGREEMPPVLYMQLRRLKLEGRAIAYQASLDDGDQHDLGPAVAAVRDRIREQARDGRAIFEGPVVPAQAAEEQPAVEAPPPQSDAQGDSANDSVDADSKDGTKTAEKAPDKSYTRDLMDITARLITKKRKDGTQEKTLGQITQVMEAFVEITEVSDITDLRQAHLSHYVDTLGDLPKSYRKSPKDHDKPISYFLELAKEMPPAKTGLAANTINRNLGFLGMVLKRATVEGHAVDRLIDLTDLRAKKTRSQRDERRSFTAEDVQAIFRSPVWTGSHSAHYRRRPGAQLIRDGHFWVPLIAALSGARREEIAGLAPEDIREIDCIWCIDICPNALRGLKTAMSARLVPVHSQLIELGLLAHVEARQGQPDLFPELRPGSAKGSYGDKLDHLFRNVLDDQVPDRDRKSFHSFRHYVVDVLTNQPDLRREHRDDILGHMGQGMGAARYGSGTNITNRKAVIERLPRIAALEGR